MQYCDEFVGTFSEWISALLVILSVPTYRVMKMDVRALCLCRMSDKLSSLIKLASRSFFIIVEKIFELMNKCFSLKEFGQLI